MTQTSQKWYSTKQFKWLLSIALLAIIWFIPTTQTYTQELKVFFMITVFAVSSFAMEILPMPAVSMMLPVAYILLLDTPTNVAFASWSLEIPWLIISGFIITNLLEKTGLMKRIAYRSIVLMGGTYKGIIIGLIITGVILAFLIADISAKAVLIGALALSIVKALDLELTGPASAGIGAATIVSVTGTSYLILTGSTGSLVPMGIVSAAGYAAPTFMEYIYHMTIPQLIFIILCTIAILLVFKPEKEIDSKEYFKEELTKLGPLKIQEKKLAVLFLGLIALIVTSDFHGVSVGWLFVSLIFVLFLPGIDIAEQEDFKSINFSFILFVTACLTIGIVSSTIGAGQFVADIFVPLMQGGVYQTISGVWGLGWIANFALTPLAGYSAFTEPLIGIAESLNINFLPMIYTIIQAMENVLFPYEYAGILLIFGYGMMSYKDIVKYSGIKSLLSLLCFIVVYIPYWLLIGLL